ncbi:hypothetical protein PXK58_09060 [Phaeobacter gallaeciensis]|uniref:hypothetical protein n=1 Tax=Phaeobacter gallaeciensis TaxID=60890 RepID=UPI0023802F5E|nr:hypothetical protein [Phaeobacter gallaeciensis]MDE4274725.1 hypothetical protein [Phaeobacter gallaeciensis]MDE4299701.1 hypothetical protein [Phaeobacter gallaeciensis]MDE5184866.1 hypothetical protein [Phaeobacter gallaeciensis]
MTDLREQIAYEIKENATAKAIWDDWKNASPDSISSMSEDAADAILELLKGAVEPLEWDVDGRSLRMDDDTMLMGKGYDWDGYEVMRQEGYGLGCGYIIWPDSIGSKTFSLYGTIDGLYIQNLDGEDAAKAAAQDDYERRQLAALGVK